MAYDKLIGETGRATGRHRQAIFPEKPNHPGQLFLEDIKQLPAGTKLWQHRGASPRRSATFRGTNDKAILITDDPLDDDKEHYFVDAGLVNNQQGWNHHNWYTLQEEL